jgi:hypothetical protein
MIGQLHGETRLNEADVQSDDDYARTFEDYRLKSAPLGEGRRAGRELTNPSPRKAQIVNPRSRRPGVDSNLLFSRARCDPPMFKGLAI